ncbi:cytochrome P450 71D11-like [Cynara cardunculus var. scolymus]|uniref:cytochrome P450 71D11-like n=1 Tax=Cynara cardunculus var. scolymus TaxID=59895 RepID=UPI000D623795|nr:cytochrome P450 71D11-like [Cynara cardunculus var. scolymus]
MLGVKDLLTSRTDLTRLLEPVFLLIQIVFAFLIFMLLKLLRLSRTKNSTPCLPPGPWKLPLLGSIHHLGSSLPHHRLRDLAKKYGPLMHLQLGELSVIVVSSPETAKEVMKTHDVTFADRPYLFASSVICNGATNLTFAPYGDYWKQLRKICAMELLSPMRVQSFRSTREEEVSHFIKSISENIGSPIDLSERIFSLTYGITARAAFGKKCKDQESFISLVKEATAAAAGFNISDIFPSSTVLPILTGFKAKLEKIRGMFEEIVDNIIEEHKAKKMAANVGDADEDEDEDLVDVLLRFQERGDVKFPLSIANIKAVILDIFSGGSETSSTTVEWGMSELLKHPRMLEKAQTEIRQVVNRRGTVDETCIQELVFLKLVIKETLRLHPPTPLLLPRESRERCEINGYAIPAKSKVIVNAWAIGRDPMWWKDPERFHPERFLSSSIDYRGLNFEYIPFGAGRRVCPGMSFGLANVELPLIKLLYHFDWNLLDGITNEDLDMNEAFGVTVRRKANLNLIPTAYHSCPA